MEKENGAIDEQLDANLEIEEFDNDPVEADASPEPAKAAEPQGDGDESDEGEKPKRSLVPHSALHQERLRRQALEKRLNEIEGQYQTFNQRMAELRERAQSQENAPPDPETDPIAALKYTQQELAKQRQAAEQQAREQQEQAQRNAQIAALDSSYRGSWEAKFSESPESREIYQGFIQNLDRHFQMRGYDMQQRAALIADEERAIAFSAFQRGIDPADVVIATYGQMLPQVTPQRQQQPDAQQVVERRQKAAPAARSLSNAGGKSDDGAMTAERIANMSMEEYEAWRDKATPAQIRRFLGGA